MPLWTGEPILLRVVPVDPRDMFRGDYVALSYDFSRIPAQGIPELRQAVDTTGNTSGRARRSTCRSCPRKTANTGGMGRISVAAAGRREVSSAARSPAGIESSAASSRTTCKRERAANTKTRSAIDKLSAEVALAADGRAVLRGLHIESPLPTAAPAYERAGNFRWPSDTTYRVRRLPHANIQHRRPARRARVVAGQCRAALHLPLEEGRRPADRVSGLLRRRVPVLCLPRRGCRHCRARQAPRQGRRGLRRPRGDVSSAATSR